MSVRESIARAVSEALRRLDMASADVPVQIERPRDASHGDVATPVAMSLAKKLKRNPIQIAEAIAQSIELPPDVVSGVEAVKPGFINFRLALPVLQRTVREVLAQADRYGASNDGAGKKIQVEYVSANPTGPLVIVSARAAAVGNSLLALLDFAGYGTEGEYYVNDYGKQVEALGESFRFRLKERLGRTAAGESIEQYQYPGGYLSALAAGVDEHDAQAWIDPSQGAAGLGRQAADRLLGSIRSDLEAYGARFDQFFRESSLHPGQVEAARRRLVASGHTYEQDGALFFRSTDFGDDKDRVIQKSDGEPTYFLADIAYHASKLDRGFQRAIGLLGPDHHGHVPRMQAAMAALGAPSDWLEIIIVGWVRLLEDGKPVSMSKRAGEFITMRELIDDVGVDVAKYFFLMRRANSPLDFDLTLARKQSDENPVYYVQYAHARIASVVRFAEERGAAGGAGADLSRLTAPEERALMLHLLHFPGVVAGAAEARESHRIATYAQELATAFHQFYHVCRIVGEDPALSAARLDLARATRIVLKNSLQLLGVSAPASM
ncbi:MAG TPA: arginine--tRNA ligase [Candidatus Krumholzibacteria bacterium]|nr:arginine--tRNA ligase [Candidatus Krumholzibacteria bacterium]